MLKQACAFRLDGKPIFCAPFGAGHINQTFLLVDDTGREYILQKVNRKVFPNPQILMENIMAVTGHLQKTAATPRESLVLVPTKEGASWLVDEQGDFWRVYEYISDSICLQKAGSPNDFRESGVAFGRFQRQLADFPAETLHETIPCFHHTPRRYDRFKAVLADSDSKAKDAAREIAFALEREACADTLINLQAAGKLPLRITHNDTKLNNVLLDRCTRRALCVIDLDTVMPGLSPHDFGDAIRFGASTAAEDEQDLTRVTLSLELFRAFTGGFLSTCGKSLTGEELAVLCDGAKLMTLECGVRFLTDYLEGDVYFATSRALHNLDRCRTQFKLVTELERQWPQLQKIVEEEAEKWRF